MPRGEFGWRGRAETNVSLAMLPVGLTLSVLSALAVPLLVGFGAIRFFHWRSDRDLLVILWSLASALVGLRATQLAIEGLSGFNWRRIAQAAALWAVVALLWPGWWIGRG